MRKIRFWKRPFALALSLCMIFSAFGQVTYADGAETGGTDTAIETPAEGDTSSNPSDSSESGTQNQWGQDSEHSDTPDVPETPEAPDNPTPENPNPENPETPKNPNPENPNPENPETPENPNPDNPNPDNPNPDNPNPDNPNPENPDPDNPNPENPNPENPGPVDPPSDTGDDDGTQTQWVKYCPKHEDHDENCGYIEGKHSCEHSCYYCENLCEHHPEHTGECGFIDGEAECGYFCEICNPTAEPTLPVCPNHTTHDENCGYVEGTSPCNHVCEYCFNLCEDHKEHDDKCGYLETGRCSFSCPNCGEEKKNLCKHHITHDETCGYIKGESPCKYDCKLCQEEQKNLCPHHTCHNATCGYEEGVHPCTFICDYCKNLCPHHPEHNKQCGFEANGECSFVCNKCATEWAWVDEEEYLVYSEETGLWYLSLPGASPETPITREILAGFLPKTVMINTAADTAKDADKEEENPDDPPEDADKDNPEDTENTTPDNPSDAALNTASETPEGTTESTTPEETPSDNPTDTNAPADTETDAGGDTAPTYAKALTLTWDLTAFPEEGAWEGTYTLTAKLPEEYALAKGAEELMVVVMIGETGIYAPTKYLNDWSWVIPEGSELYSEDDGSGGKIWCLKLAMNAIFNQYDLKTLLEKKLPSKIYASGWQDMSLPWYGFTYDKYENKKHWGWLDITWDYTQLPADITSTAPYELTASNNDYFGVNGPERKIKIIPYVISLHLDEHTVTAASPQNVTVNLFDYWVKTEKPSSPDGDILDKNDNHYHQEGEDGNWGESTTPTKYSTEVDWNLGINQKHLLLFGDGMIHAGLWNKGAGENCLYGRAYAGMEGIVKNVLPANGYPEMNLALAKEVMLGENSTVNRDHTLIKDYLLTGDHKDAKKGEGTNEGYTYDSENIQNLSNTVIRTWGGDIENGSESLAYLFDESTGDNKKRYENVTGLFQLDDEGYYWYNMRKNFAAFDESKNQFILYDAPATTRTDGKNSIGNFFPFNKGTEVFNGLDKDGNLTSSVPCARNTMNHHLGMTVDVTFRQPLRGEVVTSSGNKPMTFEFSGDDDVWVFIDDVLVLDIGGIHSDLYGIIDFATGGVYVGRGYGGGEIEPGIPKYTSGQAPGECVIETTIRDQFKAAGKEDDVQWMSDTANTFASNTSHTLKMFYLERGNYDSSLALRFNLQNKLPQRIKKVDQYGVPLPNVEFALYEAEPGSSSDIECLYTDSNINENKTFYMKQKEGAAKLVSLATNAEGYAEFTTGDGDDDYFNFADRGDQYYILKETKKPDGYRQQPIDIVLHYDPTTSMLSVANRWTTGAYACSFSNVTGAQNLNYAVLNDAQSELITGEEQVPKEDIADGLVVAVPMLRNKKAVPGEIPWMALYGGNVIGFNSVKIDKNYGEAIPSWRAAVLGAALMQAATNGTADWHLEWDSENNRLKGTLDDLPGLANRYLLYNEEDGDLQMVYGIIPPDVLTSLGISGANAAERYQALRTKLQTETVKHVFDTITTNKFRLISVKQFNRDFRSLIYIPNERRELYVKKIDQDGNPLPGAEFTLFTDKDCKNKASNTSFGRTDADGRLLFSPNVEENTPGKANMAWGEVGTEYYLKETASPDPAKYDVNETVIPVVVGTYGIYADAGTENDGVSVAADVGRLTQTMRQYAMGNDVDITLQDVTAVMQTQESGSFQLTGGWKDAILDGTGEPGVVRSMNLHFKNDNEFVDYGLHDEDGGKHFKPFFVTKTGFVRTRVMQSNIHYGSSPTDINKDQLGNTDLTNLFSLLNMVIVTDKTTQETNTGELTISKKVINVSEDEYKKNTPFTFHITLTKDGKPLEGKYYYFYGDDKVGSLEHYITDKDTFVLHHDESITILGLPVETVFTVTEVNPGEDWYVSPESKSYSGTIGDKVNFNAAFVNSRKPFPDLGGLKVSKTVTGGTDADKNTPFTFEVKLTGDKAAITGQYGEMEFKDGVATFTLKNGESKTAENLPVGVTYTVTESGNDGYKVTSTNANGTITKDTTSEAAFTNRKDTPSRPSSSSSSSRPSSSSDPSEPSEPSEPSSSSSSRSSSSSSSSSRPSSSSNTSSSSTPETPPELPDPNDPDSPDRVTIEYPNGETRTYVKVWNPDRGEWVYILDEDVPMTGMDWQTIWVLLYVGALLAIAGVICSRRTGKNNDEKKE